MSSVALAISWLRSTLFVHKVAAAMTINKTAASTKLNFRLNERLRKRYNMLSSLPIRQRPIWPRQ
jgi:hypothetical protein